MKPSIKNFAANFQSLNATQLNKVVGGNGAITTYIVAVGKRRDRNGGRFG